MPHLPEIRRRWLAGESHITIAAAIGLSPGLLLQRMHKARQRYGRDILPMRVRRRALMSDADAHAADIAAKQRAEEYAQAIQPLWSATVSVGVLASRLGVSAEVVRYRIRFIRRWLGSDVLPKQR